VKEMSFKSGVKDQGSVLVDAHRTRSAAARLPINRTRSSDFL